MDKSILPGMTKKSFGFSWGKKKKAKKKVTQPGAMDDNAMERARKRREALKRAASND